MRVLICEDDREVVDTVQMAIDFKWPDCEVCTAGTAQDSVAAALGEAPDIIILDVNFPDGDGFSVLEEVRKSSGVPVIMLTVRASEAEKVRGLELGADDYMAKPFSAFELIARAGAVLRRAATAGESHSDDLIEVGPIRMKPGEGEIMVREQSVRLTPTEFNILEILARNAGSVVSPGTLLKEIWGVHDVSTDAYLIKLHMKNLRRKLGDNSSRPQIITTIRGFGYKMAANRSQQERVAVAA